MAGNPFFSVIMPVYGVEPYLKDCVNSVLNQKYQDFEVVLVDDCSKDQSGKICDELAETDERISVIHLPENGGLSNARNQGLAIAKGEYVLFLDSDDEFDDSLLSAAYEAIEKNPAEVTVYGLVEEYFDADGKLVSKKEVKADRDYFFDNQHDLRKFVISLEKNTLYGYAWNKVYRTDYIKQINAQFKKITLIEDIDFNVSVFQNITNLNVLSNTPYRYKKRNNTSLTNKFVKDYFDLQRQRIKLVLDQYKSWDLCDENVKIILAQIYTRYIISALQRNCEKASQLNRKARKIWLKDLYSDEIWIELSPYLPASFSMLGIMGWLLTHHMTEFVLMAGRFIYSVRKLFPVLFSLIKKSA